MGSTVNVTISPRARCSRVESREPKNYSTLLPANNPRIRNRIGSMGPFSSSSYADHLLLGATIVGSYYADNLSSTSNW